MEVIKLNFWEVSSINSADAFNGMHNEHSVISSLTTKNSNENVLPTVMLGLITEVDCFKAIKELGDAKFFLKKVISDLALVPNSSKEELAKAAVAVQQVHTYQLNIVNDVCKRFGVIHPELKDPTPEMLKTKTLYWDWYKDQHKKVYGSYPEIIEKK